MNDFLSMDSMNQQESMDLDNPDLEVVGNKYGEPNLNMDVGMGARSKPIIVDEHGVSVKTTNKSMGNNDMKALEGLDIEYNYPNPNVPTSKEPVRTSTPTYENKEKSFVDNLKFGNNKTVTINVSMPNIEFVKIAVLNLDLDRKKVLDLISEKMFSNIDKENLKEHISTILDDHMIEEGQ